MSAGVAEGREIEFKRELPGRSAAEGKEFLSDVWSFVNAGGGDLLYGIEAISGVAVGVPGVAVADAELLRLDSVILASQAIYCRGRGCFAGWQMQYFQGFPRCSSRR